MNEEYHLGRYGTFMHRFTISRWSWSIALCKFEDNWSIHFFCFWIRLMRPKTEPYEIMEKYGIDVYFDERYIALGWGRYYKHIYFPWAFDHARWYQGRRDGTFDRVEHCYYSREPIPPIYYREVFPYKYVRKNGDVQDRMATVTVERITSCWRGWPFRWFYWPMKTSTFINVNFNDAVGEQTGSWKGGVVGCGYDLRPNETPEQCLRRMESERKFD